MCKFWLVCVHTKTGLQRTRMYTLFYVLVQVHPTMCPTDTNVGCTPHHFIPSFMALCSAPHNVFNRQKKNCTPHIHTYLFLNLNVWPCGVHLVGCTPHIHRYMWGAPHNTQICVAPRKFTDTDEAVCKILSVETELHPTPLPQVRGAINMSFL